MLFPWSRVLFQVLEVSSLLKSSHAFSGVHSLIAMVTISYCLSLSCARRILSVSSTYFFKAHFNILPLTPRSNKWSLSYRSSNYFMGTYVFIVVLHYWSRSFLLKLHASHYSSNGSISSSTRLKYDLFFLTWIMHGWLWRFFCLV